MSEDSTKDIGRIRRALKDETALLLSTIAVLILAIEALSALGLWSLPWFQNSISEITLTFLSLFALAVVSQGRIHERRFSELNEAIAAPSDLVDGFNEVGISRIWTKDRRSTTRRRELIREARTLDVASVSAYTWTYNNTDLLKELLVKKGCNIRIVLAEPNSDFIDLRERREGEERQGAISAEISASIGLLRQLVTDVEQELKLPGQRRSGTLEIRHCKSDMPCRVEIVDGSTVHWTPYILPARSTNMPAFEVHSSADGITTGLLISYFEMLWQESETTTVLTWSTQSEGVQVNANGDERPS